MGASEAVLGVCALYDLSDEEWVEPDADDSMADRAREYNRWLRAKNLHHGGVNQVRFADPPAYEVPTALYCSVDSAIWTGTYLAAEALRLKATGSADARASVRALVQTLHLWFNVSGEPGILVRWAALADQHPLESFHSDRMVHYGVPFEGQLYDFIGEVSRDQYQGVLLGYALAYEALGEADEATRALIREDVVELLDELMLERQLPITVTYNGWTAPLPTTVMARFMVVSPREMSYQGATLVIDSSSLDETGLFGFQEFIPNLALIVRQVPLLGWVPDIPRAGSAIMLAAAFQVGMLVTADLPAFHAKHQQIRSFHLEHDSEWGNIDDWLAIAKLDFDSSTCGKSYYGHNIVMQPMYTLARLERDPVRRAIIVDEVLTTRKWPSYANTKNSFFSYIYLSSQGTPDLTVMEIANDQLSQFNSPPRTYSGVDLTEDPRFMPHEAGCDPPQANHSTAVDVRERPPTNFLWQNHPWRLTGIYDLHVLHPGVDYLVAYWMARHHAFLVDEHPQRCLVWRQP